MEKMAELKDDDYLQDLCGRLEDLELDVPTVTREELYEITSAFSQPIGVGAFGEVFKGSWRDNDVAVKVLRLGSFEKSKDFIKILKREVDITFQLSSPNIVKLLAFCSNTRSRVPAPAMVFQYANAGTLFEAIFAPTSNSPALSPKLILRVSLNVASALEYLHSYHQVLVHRDIKSSNVLLDNRRGKFCAILADFGLARCISQLAVQGGQVPASLTCVVGTQGYVDPVYVETCEVQPSMDVYSYGVVLMEMLWREKPDSMLGRRVRQTPLDECIDKALQICLKDGPVKYSKPIEELATVAKESLELANPKDRPTAKEIVQRIKRLYRS